METQGYHPRYNSVRLIKSFCFHVAKTLGQDIMDNAVIIGGIVPSLLIDQEKFNSEADRHIGTMDLDIGFSLAIKDNDCHLNIIDRLHSAGFKPNLEKNNLVTPRWKLKFLGREMPVDFLITKTEEDDQFGATVQIHPQFSAIAGSGLQTAFFDRQKIRFEQKDEKITNQQSIWVCGPGAFIVMKALAYNLRKTTDKGPKDAYDIFYMLRYYGNGIKDVAESLTLIRGFPDWQQTRTILTKCFSQDELIGPRHVTQFLSNQPEEVVKADVAGYVRQLLKMV